MGIHTGASYSSNESEREKKNRKIAYEAAVEGIVLLENKNVLPIAKGKVALFGAGAGKTIKGGTGSGEVMERYSVSILEGMEQCGFQVTTKSWIKGYEKVYEKAWNEYGKQLIKMSLKMDYAHIMENPFQYPAGQSITEEDMKKSNTDTCIYVISRQAGEGGDRKIKGGDYHLRKEEREHIRTCCAFYKKMILVINAGASIDMGFLDEYPEISAVIFFCQQGMEGGRAFADLLCGEQNFSGKLTDTWAKHYEDIPYSNEYSYLNGDVNNEYYKEGIYVGYRYFDSFGVVPRYPFGYGLSYTDFEIKVENASLEKTKIHLKVCVKNIGTKYSGKEVVQVYMHCPNGRMEKEEQRLVAFAKTNRLMPQESESIDVCFDLSQAKSYDEANHAYILESGNYEIYVGDSSRNHSLAAIVKIQQEVTLSVHKPISGCEKFKMELHRKTDTKDAEREVDCHKYIPTFTISANVFETVYFMYEAIKTYHDKQVDKLLNKMSVKELVDVVVGVGWYADSSEFVCPGSVGNTTSKFVNQGLSNAVLCDGPAGLRLQQVSAITKKNKVKPITLSMAVLEQMPRFVKKFMTGNPKKDTLIYQYTTAFPVETALAQTWNEELLECVGKVLSEEMSEYGVTYWLAPALNIHRNPLCGRNFEYFSEDPYLSGKSAAAITRGVQSITGNYATLKHFACNNQEDNRRKSSSNVDERTLREIYLTGFEIAVKESQAKAVMTSYNLINGIYAPNHYDLLSNVLRIEWGFDGVVMTDWGSTAKGLATNGMAMKAGNDMIMSGGKYEKKEILFDIKRGTICEEDIRRCAANILHQILESNTQKRLNNDADIKQ